jgi:hypothetical protein
MKNISITMTEEQATSLFFALTRAMVDVRMEQEKKGEKYNVLNGDIKELQELISLIPDSCIKI